MFHVDQVAASRHQYDRKTLVSWLFSIGEDIKDDDPLLQGIRGLLAAQALPGMFFGRGHHLRVARVAKTHGLVATSAVTASTASSQSCISVDL